MIKLVWAKLWILLVKIVTETFGFSVTVNAEVPGLSSSFSSVKQQIIGCPFTWNGYWQKLCGLGASSRSSLPSSPPVNVG